MAKRGKNKMVELIGDKIFEAIILMIILSAAYQIWNASCQPIGAEQTDSGFEMLYVGGGCWR